jgi:nucleotide-binding universal stress UspA family protein
MFSTIVVALDGSHLAERILPHVEALAERFGARVSIVRALTPPEKIVASVAAAGDPMGSSAVDPTPIMEAEEDDATAYLDRIAARLRARGITVEAFHTAESPVEALIEHAHEIGADLIAMATHGRGGLRRLVFGSVTEDVLHHAPCPLLLLKVEHDED